MTAAKEGEATKEDEGVVLNPDFKFNMEDIVSVCKRRGFIFQVRFCRWAERARVRGHHSWEACLGGRLDV